MRASRVSAVAGLILGVTTMASMATPIAINLIGGFGLWQDSFASTPISAGAYVQVWWSLDSSYGQSSPGVVGIDEAGMADGDMSATYGDYVIWSGNTPDDAGFLNPEVLGTFTDADVGGQTVSSGHVYVYIYQDGTPDVGDQGVMTEIYGPNGSTPGSTLNWANANADPKPDADPLPVSTSETDGVLGGSNGFVVVPEPGTMALVGVGALTIAARRRRKTA